MNNYKFHKTKEYYQGKESCHRRSVYKGMGFTDEDLDKPIIAVINTWSEVCPGHMHLKDTGAAVKNGIWQAGGMPMEFCTISQCATQVLGLEGIKYDLPARDQIAFDIETIVNTQLFDGVVVIATCDKTIPGALLGAARLDLPTVIVPGGIMDTGKVKCNEVSLADLDEKVFSGRIQEFDDESVAEWENNVIPTCGACPIMGTANTMQTLSEALGVSLPGSSTVRANSAQHLRFAKKSGNKIMDLIKEGIVFSDIVTPKSMTNMVKTAMAIGAASNSVLHMLALSYQMGYEDTINREYFGEVSEEINCILDVKPVGTKFLTHIEDAGGMPVVLSRLENKLDLSCLTVSGLTIKEIVDIGKKIENSESPNVIRTFDNPIMESGGIKILKGNLAPKGCVVRTFANSIKKHEGNAKIFTSQKDAMEAIKKGDIVPGDVIVLRFMGPKGAPGMPDCFGVAGAVVGAGLEESVAVITDGRFSGFARGIGVCQISPEAATKGPLAFVREGDRIVIDIENNLINDIETDFNDREPILAPKRNEKGILSVYSKVAEEAFKGARLI